VTTSFSRGVISDLPSKEVHGEHAHPIALSSGGSWLPGIFTVCYPVRVSRVYLGNVGSEAKNILSAPMSSKRLIRFASQILA
jgi:hypothetical protein